MKVLVIPSWYPPNGGSFFREHAIALATEGLHVDVLAGLYASIRKTPPLRWMTKDWVSINKEENIREITRICPIIPFSERLNYHAWIRTMLSFYDEYIKNWGHPDLIQVHSSLWAGVVASRISRQYKIPYVITEHRGRFVYNSQEAHNLFKPWYTGPLNEAFKHAEAIITVSQSLHKKIIDIHPMAEEKLGVIYNMGDTDFFKPGEIKKEESGIFHLFSLAYLERIKGMDTLIDAMEILNSRFPGKYHLTIGGDGSEKHFLQKRVQEKNLDKKITFPGKLNRQQILDAFHNADAFVLPSRFEAFGIVFIEAMSCGLPVIAGRSGGPESFITPQTGTIVNPDEPESLANAIYEMRNNNREYSAAHIRDYAVNTFSRPIIARKYTELYNTIIERRKDGK
jgi:L-malate glycosyltransferase